MTELMWIRSHVERCLQDEWGCCQVTVDEDGDYPFRAGTAACWVSVLETEPIMVRVSAQAAYGLRQSAKLLAELNAIQLSALSASIGLADDTVVVSQTLSPIGLSGPALAQAIHAVGGVASDVGLLLAGMFGGQTPYPASEQSAEEEAR
jgi:hypothetical protein